MNMFTILVPKVEETYQFFSLLQILLDLDLDPLDGSVIQDGVHSTTTQLVCVGICQKNSVTTVQRAFRRIHHGDLPTNKSILKWYRDFNEKGCIHTLYSPSRP